MQEYKYNMRVVCLQEPVFENLFHLEHWKFKANPQHLVYKFTNIPLNIL